MTSSVNVFDGLKAQLVAMRKGKKHKRTEAPDFVTFFLASGEVQCENVRMASWQLMREKLKRLTKSADASAMNYGTVVHQMKVWLEAKHQLPSGWRRRHQHQMKVWLERAVPTADPTTAAAEHAPARSKPALGQPHAKKLRLRGKCTQLQPRATAPVATPSAPDAAPPIVLPPGALDALARLVVVRLPGTPALQNGGVGDQLQHRLQRIEDNQGKLVELAVATNKAVDAYIAANKDTEKYKGEMRGRWQAYLREISARRRCAEVHGGAQGTPDTADAKERESKTHEQQVNKKAAVADTRLSTKEQVQSYHRNHHRNHRRP